MIQFSIVTFYIGHNYNVNSIFFSTDAELGSFNEIWDIVLKILSAILHYQYYAKLTDIQN